MLTMAAILTKRIKQACPPLAGITNTLMIIFYHGLYSTEQTKTALRYITNPKRAIGACGGHACLLIMALCFPNE